jgi:hypothetical protein
MILGYLGTLSQKKSHEADWFKSIRLKLSAASMLPKYLYLAEMQQTLITYGHHLSDTSLSGRSPHFWSLPCLLQSPSYCDHS